MLEYLCAVVLCDSLKSTQRQCLLVCPAIFHCRRQSKLIHLCDCASRCHLGDEHLVVTAAIWVAEAAACLGLSHRPKYSARLFIRSTSDSIVNCHENICFEFSDVSQSIHKQCSLYTPSDGYFMSPLATAYIHMLVQTNYIGLYFHFCSINWKKIGFFNQLCLGSFLVHFHQSVPNYCHQRSFWIHVWTDLLHQW